LRGSLILKNKIEITLVQLCCILNFIVKSHSIRKRISVHILSTPLKATSAIRKLPTIIILMFQKINSHKIVSSSLFQESIKAIKVAHLQYYKLQQQLKLPQSQLLLMLMQIKIAT